MAFVGGVPTPNYVREVQIQNNSGEALTAVGRFQSGEQGAFAVAPGAQQTVSRDINQGSFTTVDPVVTLTVNLQNGQNLNVPLNDGHGIQIRQYVYNGNGQLARAQ